MIHDDHVTARPTLLLIDDCVAQRDLYEMILQEDFNVLTAVRGDDGLELAASKHPDAIVLDVMMPGLSGWETCTRLKSEAATTDIPVILLTAANDPDLSDHAMAVGAAAILAKPCAADTLRDTIITTIELSHAPRASVRNVAK